MNDLKGKRYLRAKGNLPSSSWLHCAHLWDVFDVMHAQSTIVIQPLSLSDLYTIKIRIYLLILSDT